LLAVRGKKIVTDGVAIATIVSMDGSIPLLAR
jgi:hypothetical protein